MNGLSIITATHGRSQLVRVLLESLAVERQSVDFSVEVILVDSSPPDEALVIRAACDKWRAIYQNHPRNNVREKRNLAVALSQYDAILFVDSDCAAEPGLLREHYQSLQVGQKVGGVIGVTEFVGPNTQIFRVIEKTSLLDAFSYAKRHAVVPWGPTCNISYRKAILTDLGLFDESFPFRLGGDDTDLGLRVTDSGHQIVANPRAMVTHTKTTWNGVDLIASRVFRWGRMHFHLLRKHPKRVYYDFPTLGGVLLLLCLSAVAAAPFVSWELLAVPLLWLAVQLLFESLIIARLLRCPLPELPHLLAARLLSLLFETGTLLEAARHGSGLPLVKEISYSPPSLEGRYRRVGQIWAMLLSLMLVFWLVVLWMRV